MKWVFLVCCSALGLGCGDDAAVSAPDAGTLPDSGPVVPRDAGPPPEALTYSPEGCSHEVRTPEVIEARMSADALGPMPSPDFVHASFAGPTDSSFAVNWRTDGETTVTQLLYGTDEAAVAVADAADEPAGVIANVGHHVLFAPLSGGTVRLHEVHVCGLSASTTYYYKVGGPGAWSDVYDIATGPAIGATASFRFAALGDSRNDSLVWAEIQKKAADRMPDFQVFTGDAVVLGANQPDWDGFFGEAYMGTRVQESLARIPMMPANGNHEGLAVNYLLQFALPQEQSVGERAEGEEWYSFDYGNVHFVVLNDTAPETLIRGAQAEWLEADLAAVNRAVTPWVIAMHHKPPYSCSNHGSQMVPREAWQPIYDAHAVDLVINGHDHNYERSHPIRGFQPGTMDGMIVPEGEGTVYVVTGGAGAPLYGSGSDCAHTVISESTYHYAIVDVDDATLTFTAYRIDDTMLDTFTLTK